MANLRIAELDFETIKDNLKEFMKTQAEFSDYDFEGSGLNVLIDLLAYNTHYNAYLANMLMNEMFLESAVKRSSAVSIAKHLGYVPTSVTGAVGEVDIIVNNPVNFPSSLTLERYTTFSSTINGSAYSFLNTEPVTISPTNGVYLFSGVKIKEGKLLQYNHTVVNPGPDEKYVIPNSDADINSIFVTIQNSSSDTFTESFIRATDISNYDGASNVYFIEENALGQYEIYFGDGIVGKKLSPGNIITIRYLVSSGIDANVSSVVDQSFTATSAIGGSNDITVTTISNSTGGSDREGISSIRFNAPKANLAKDRVVNKSDYSTVIKSNFPGIKSVAVWGGEENVPPAYGKVFISLTPNPGFAIDTAVLETIKNDVLKDRQVLVVTPEFVDPDYSYLQLNVTVKYNKNLTTLPVSSIIGQVRDAVTNFFVNNLQSFDKNFYHSQLVEVLNNVNLAIVSINIEVGVQKRIIPALNISNGYIESSALNYNNRLHPGEIRSTVFYISSGGETIPVRLRDVPDQMPPSYEGTGTMIIYNSDTGVKISDVGTVDYVTGLIEITDITPVGYPTGVFDIRITAQLQELSTDVVTTKNQVIDLDDTATYEIANREAGLTISAVSV